MAASTTAQLNPSSPLFSRRREPPLQARTRTLNSKPPHSTRRPLLLLSTALSLPSPPSSAAATTTTTLQPDTTITDRVFLDFCLCPTSFIPDRSLATDENLFPCTEPEPLGRLVLGLYGKHVPLTVSNFKAMCSSSAYKGTLVHKIFPGEFFLAGRQGRRDRGEVQPPLKLAPNTETVDSRAFALGHSRGGVVSLCLSENDDDAEIRLDPNYHNVEFLITTGPGPCPQLDNRNIVFGTVIEGLDVVTTIASIPTYKPAERIRQFNDFAKFLGDDRAQIARGTWNRPLKTVYISDCGEVRVAKPSLSPTLP